MKIAYFDCSSGISGDMCISALVSAGASLTAIKKELKNIPVGDYKIHEKKVKRGGLEAVNVDVEDFLATGKSEDSHWRTSRPSRWKEIRDILNASSLDTEIKEQALKIIKSIYLAEAVVHGELYDRIHIHELSGVDTIVDVVGTLVGLKLLGIKKVVSSPINLGGGAVKTKHGLLPVPAPATMELLRNVPAYSSGVPHELTTPTGASIIKGIATEFGPMPMMNVVATGIGAGMLELKDRPNILRVFVGESTEPSEGVLVIETNIDDMNPQVYDYVMAQLFKQGALDVFLTPIIMKKCRPGIKLTAIVTENKKNEVIETFFKETTTIGLRYYSANRETLKRTIETVDTEFGGIRVKVSKTETGVKKISPEYEDCKKAALKHKVPILEVMKKTQGKRGD